MHRRRVLYGVGAFVSASGAMIGSGAFSTVEADRAVTVNTVPDKDAYLRLTDRISGGSDEFSTVAVDGTIRFEFGEDIIGIPGDGLGTDSIHEFSDVFAAQNLGSEPVHLFGEYSETDLADIGLLQTSSVSASSGGVDLSSPGKDHPLTSENPSDTLYPGDVIVLGLLVDTNDVDLGTYETTLTIKAHSSGAEKEQ